MKRNRKTFGFTLVEIMIVVTIIGILASLAVPAFQNARKKAVQTSIRNNLRQIWGAAQQCMLENGVDVVALSCVIKWVEKDGTTVGTGSATGTNPGYASIIKQVANEDYSQFMCVRTEESATVEAGYLYADATSITLGDIGGMDDVTLDL